MEYRKKGRSSLTNRETKERNMIKIKEELKETRMLNQCLDMSDRRRIRDGSQIMEKMNANAKELQTEEATKERIRAQH